MALIMDRVFSLSAQPIQHPLLIQGHFFRKSCLSLRRITEAAFGRRVVRLCFPILSVHSLNR
jgi:hypothetical protein